MALGSASSQARAGYALAGGHDVDGDGFPDLVVGSPYYRVNNAAVGGLWLIRGSYLLTLPKESAESGVGPTGGLHAFASVVESSNLRAAGWTNGDELGASVALIPGAEADGRAMIVVGSPGSSLGGEAQTGAGLVFRYRLGSDGVPSGLDAHPWSVVGGESFRLGSKLGAAVAGGLSSSGALLIVGAYFGSSISIDAGSAYVVSLPVPLD